MKSPSNSAAKCWAAAADPPLPATSSLSPRVKAVATISAIASMTLTWLVSSRIVIADASSSCAGLNAATSSLIRFARRAIRTPGWLRWH